MLLPLPHWVTAKSIQECDARNNTPGYPPAGTLVHAINNIDAAMSSGSTRNMRDSSLIYPRLVLLIHSMRELHYIIIPNSLLEPGWLLCIFMMTMQDTSVVSSSLFLGCKRFT